MYRDYQNFLHFIDLRTISSKNESIITKSFLFPFHSTKKYNSYKLSRSIYERSFALLLHPFIDSNRILEFIQTSYQLSPRDDRYDLPKDRLDATFITFLIDRIELVKLVEPRSWRAKFRHVYFAKEIYRAHETKRFQFIVTAP